MDHRWLLIVCDTPGCGTQIRIPIRKGFWCYQPWQEAINAGWDVGKDDGTDRCPQHSWLGQWFSPTEDAPR